jgi:ABC-type multidrug transport system fused ATPase/permease subunit
MTAYASMENGSVAIDRIQEFARLPAEEKTSSLEEVSVNVQNGSAWPSAGSLAFSDFSMKYRYLWLPWYDFVLLTRHRSEYLPLALKNLSFDLQGGLKIGICGR